MAVLSAGCDLIDGDNGSKKRVVNSIEIIGIMEEDAYMQYEFQYDKKNRVTDIIVFNSGNEQQHAVFSHSKNSISMIDMYDDDYRVEWQLNSKGLVNQKIVTTDGDEYFTHYFYGTDGMLKSKNYEWTEESIFNRENGNVVSATLQSDNEEYYRCFYTYTSYLDKSNLDIMAILVGTFAEYPCEIPELDKTVFKSLGNRNLPQTCNQVVYYNEELRYDDNWEYRYVFDSDGYLTKVKMYRDDEYFADIQISYK